MTALRRGLTFLGWWVFLFGLYLLFVSKTQWQECVAGAVAAGIAATAAGATLGAGDLHFRLPGGWLRYLARLPGGVVRDCGILAAALWRRVVRREDVRGALRIIPFDPGGDDPRSAVRRALVVAGVSLAPNTFVVTIDRERGRLLVHQLVPSHSAGNEDREWPT